MSHHHTLGWTAWRKKTTELIKTKHFEIKFSSLPMVCHNKMEKWKEPLQQCGMGQDHAGWNWIEGHKGKIME